MIIMAELILGATLGLLSGAAYGLVGWTAAKRAKPDAQFEFAPFASSLVIGGLAGAVLGAQNVSFDLGVIEGFRLLAENFGVVFALKKVLKIAFPQLL